MDVWEIPREKNMAVHIEFFSVIVPVRAIKEKFFGKMDFFHDIFGECESDGKLMRMGAMNPMDILPMVLMLERGGLQGLSLKNCEEIWLDFCVVDRCSGPTLPCEWIEVDLEMGLVELKKD
jgi:hypothetical protein